MILDLPPETLYAIVAKAEQQGISPAELLANDYNKADKIAYPTGYSETEFNAIFDALEKYGVYSDDTAMVLDEKSTNIIQELLDNPPQPNPYMQKLLALGEQYV